MKKLKLESFRIAKLSNPKKIFGGIGINNGTDDDPGEPQRPTRPTTIINQGD